MVICFAHNRYQNLGGEDLAAKSERELLQRHGHTVDLFEADNSAIVDVAGKVRAAFRAVYSPKSRRNLAARIRSVRPNIVHVLNFFPLLSPSIYYACRDAGVPVIQKLSNFRLMCPNALLMRDGRVCEDCVGKSIPWPGVLHACYRGSRAGSATVATMITTHRILGTWESVVDAYIARTEFSRSKMIAGGLPAKKIVVVPSFAPDPGRIGNGHGGFAMFAGRLSEEKGIGTLLSAWNLIHGTIPLKVVGDGPLKEEVMRRDAGGSIQYLGTQRRETVLELMHEAAFLVVPSICYENFPLTIVEAFSCGLPVIGSNLGALGEIIKDQRTGLHFRPGDAEDLATKVVWAVAHPDGMTRMGQEARAEYLAKYTPEKNYLMLMEVYDQAVQRKSISMTH
jgi:glycosyltransferase involved in cell wall biosynthesis